MYQAIVKAFLIWTLSTRLWAIEPFKLEARYALVGIISQPSVKNKLAKSVVVLRDLSTKRTLTVSLGAKIPGSDGLRVASIGKDRVMIKGQKEEIELTKVDYDTDSGETEAESSETPSEVRTQSTDSVFKQASDNLAPIWPKSAEPREKTIVESVQPRIVLPSDGVLTSEDVEAFNDWSEARLLNQFDRSERENGEKEEN